MAYANKTITNPVNGQTITFLQTAADTDGQLLEMQSRYKAGSKEPPLHYHPGQDEDFIIESGEMHVKINGQVKICKAGDTLHIPTNTPHAMWNAGPQPAQINWKVRPALNMEQFFEQITGLAADGKTNSAGRPPFLQTALTANYFSNVFRMSKPSFPVQKLIFSLVAPIAYLFGYKSFYKKYSD
ncbi:cupin domain-containing protein [Chitinophaga barathri]|uniref:Cupin domain-containing protein n=1 Tax=Chitinophaga barathri TaxID=1647451 RepID=A0A3N4M855_9BACT|nr:cupin domain-containing protein [Chitinophaga barathri]RPD39722.1 cupin domain-containing protein [Chitinophaga barathri]